MSKRITIDPMTRLEGHLKIDVEVEDGKVKNAWSSGQLFRGIEIILQGRDPRDAHHFVQRSCGVCTYVHALTSVRAVEDAIGIDIPENAKLVRRLLHGAQFMHDHIVHFYHLHALDWVDVVSALKADPQKTAKLANNLSNAPWGGTTYYKGVQDRLKTFVESGQLGILNNAYWGHSAYKLPPEANLMASANYLEALRLQAKTAQLHAIFGGKNPHPQSLVVGGVSSIKDLTADRIIEFKYIWQESQDFVKNVYIPDLLAVASFYKDWGGIGGTTNFLAWGDFAQNGKEPESYLMPRGLIKDRDLKNPQGADQKKVTEHVTHGWYADGSPKHPYEGETKPVPGDYDMEGKYTWFKAPRYEDLSCEVGPLARVLVAYAAGVPEVKAAVDKVLKQLDAPASALFSTLGRTAARGIDALLLAQKNDVWLDQLIDNMDRGILDVHNGEKWDPASWPKEARGFGYHEAPRGALGHWIRIEDQKIANYQAVVPSTWNAGPRDAHGQMGPYEASLIDTPIADPEKPVEILRTIHSFDPCLACAVHVLDGKGSEIVKVRVL